MSIDNESFEVPSGTPPTLLSANVENFALVDGTFLDVLITNAAQFDGIYRWNVDVADFVDIGDANAVEVAAAIDGSNEGFTAVAVAGQVRLESFFNGATMSILGGQPQLVFQWPASSTGTAEFGPGGFWTVTASSQFLEWAGFGSAPELPIESFEAGWGALAAELSTVFFESFEVSWDVLVVGGAFEQGLFGGLGGDLTTDSFEFMWDDVVFVLPGFQLEIATFDAGLEAEENFEDNWNVTPVTEPFTLDPGEFNDGGDFFDGFENVVVWTHNLTVVSAVAGTYIVEINGVPYQYLATGFDTPGTIGQGLVDDINAGTQMDAAAVNPFVLTPTPLTSTIPTVVVHGPTAGSLSVVLTPNDPFYADQWVGQDILPSF